MELALRKASVAAWREWRWFKPALEILFAVIFVLAIGPQLETWLYPVLTRKIVSNVHRVSPAQLCWDFDFIKGRKALPARAYAAVYVDAGEFPYFVGIEHADGSPFGGLLGWEAGGRVVEQCIHIPNYGQSARKIAVQMNISYRTKLMPWLVDEPPIWIDWSPDMRGGPR